MRDLERAAQDCKGCRLHANATQTVFGEGLKRSLIMLVGEQPGDREDIDGRPFVGPAGRLLDRGLKEAGITRNDVYLTNIVKHFKHERVGKRRIHKKPNADEIMACRPWLDAEMSVVGPEVLVLLGATVAKALLGPAFKVTQMRGRSIASDFAPNVTATVHPSSILRARDGDTRAREFGRFVDDLHFAAELMS
ncbi:MAG: UdgX family uracil-DNA binding protein [Actinobacteria bacterium]|nr:UdgX family uracil-DNA binding protein [Actinomycetota bacterium]